MTLAPLSCLHKVDGVLRVAAADRVAAHERRLERRVDEALEDDRAAVEARRAERALNRRLRAVGIT